MDVTYLGTGLSMLAAPDNEFAPHGSSSAVAPFLDHLPTSADGSDDSSHKMAGFPADGWGALGLPSDGLDTGLDDHLGLGDYSPFADAASPQMLDGNVLGTNLPLIQPPPAAVAATTTHAASSDKPVAAPSAIAGVKRKAVDRAGGSSGSRSQDDSGRADQQPLDPERKKEQRKERNREAAKQSRDKAKQYLATLESENEALREQRDAAWREIERLRGLPAGSYTGGAPAQTQGLCEAANASLSDEQQASVAPSLGLTTPWQVQYSPGHYSSGSAGGSACGVGTCNDDGSDSGHIAYRGLDGSKISSGVGATVGGCVSRWPVTTLLATLMLLMCSALVGACFTFVALSSSQTLPRAVVPPRSMVGSVDVISDVTGIARFVAGGRAVAESSDKLGSRSDSNFVSEMQPFMLPSSEGLPVGPEADLAYTLPRSVVTVTDESAVDAVNRGKSSGMFATKQPQPNQLRHQAGADSQREAATAEQDVGLEHGWIGNDPSSNIVPSDHNDTFPLVVRAADRWQHASSEAVAAQRQAATGSHVHMGVSSGVHEEVGNRRQPHYEVADGAALQFVAESFGRAQHMPTQARDTNSSSSCIYCTQAFNIVSSQAGSNKILRAGPVRSFNPYLSLVLPAVSVHSGAAGRTGGLVEVQCKVLNVTAMATPKAVQGAM